MSTQSTAPRKPTQRPSLSCTECARRKTRCSKEVPCTGCIKRGKSHLCRVESSHQAVDHNAGIPKVPQSPTSSKQSVFLELDSLRATADLLREKIQKIELHLSTSFSFSPDNQEAHIQQYPSNGCLQGETPLASDQSTHEYHNLPWKNEDVHASVTLEVLALGRQKSVGPLENEDGNLIFHSNRLFRDSATIPSPSELFPTLKSLAEAAPQYPLSQALLDYSLSTLTWHHGSIHVQTFEKEVNDFMGWPEPSPLSDGRWGEVSLSWLALYFAVLMVGISGLSESAAENLEITSEMRANKASAWFNCSVACLYKHNFMQNHDLYVIQTLAVITSSGQDPSILNLVPTLLAAGISICQSMGLHRMISDENWDRLTKNFSLEIRAKSLIDREIKKRVFWVLTSQDWLSVFTKRAYAVHPTQITTPLPLNARDNDLLNGALINRLMEEYTGASKTLLWIQIARCLQAVFEHTENSKNPSYEYILGIDARLRSIIDDAPSWMKPNGPVDHMPPCADWIRTTFVLSTQHKLLALHRPFLAKASHESKYQPSRQGAIRASRAILREIPRAKDFRLWTVPYHASTAACVVLLDMLQQPDNPAFTEERAEVIGALQVLKQLQDTSSIACRGVVLLEILLNEEHRLSLQRREGSLKRQHDDRDNINEFAQVTKKMNLSNVAKFSGVDLSSLKPSRDGLKPEIFSTPVTSLEAPQTINVSTTAPLDPFSFRDGIFTGLDTSYMPQGIIDALIGVGINSVTTPNLNASYFPSSGDINVEPLVGLDFGLGWTF